MQIAIAVDGSPTSGVLVRWAAQTLLRASDDIVLLHAPRGLDEYHTLAAAGALVDCEAMLTRFFRTGAEKKGPPQRQQLRTLRLAAEAEPREALVAACEAEGPFDMLLVGSRGLGALKRAAAAVTGHGSVSSHLIAHAPCPVLVVTRSALLAWVEEAAMPPEATTAHHQASAHSHAEAGKHLAASAAEAAAASNIEAHAAMPATPAAKAAPVAEEITPQKEV